MMNDEFFDVDLDVVVFVTTFIKYLTKLRPLKNYLKACRVPENSIAKDERVDIKGDCSIFIACRVCKERSVLIIRSLRSLRTLRDTL